VLILLGEVEAGHAGASDQLFAALYAELHRLADRELKRIGPDLSLGTTTLLHEAYLDLAGREGVRFPDRARFMAYASRAMRGLVIDYVRRSRAQKRGGGAFEITLTDSADKAPAGNDPDELQRLSDALDQLAQVDLPLAQLVDLHSSAVTRSRRSPPCAPSRSEPSSGIGERRDCSCTTPSPTRDPSLGQ
jgi:RNA polymerase sigma factor (TIGR02999 family)